MCVPQGYKTRTKQGAYTVVSYLIASQPPSSSSAALLKFTCPHARADRSTDSTVTAVCAYTRPLRFQVLTAERAALDVSLISIYVSIYVSM